MLDFDAIAHCPLTPHVRASYLNFDPKTDKLASPKQEQVMEGLQAVDCLISSYKQSLSCAKRKFIVMHLRGVNCSKVGRVGNCLDNFIELPNVQGKLIVPTICGSLSSPLERWEDFEGFCKIHDCKL